MFNLNFSEALILPYNQRTSIVIDGVARTITENSSEKMEESPLLLNYGFIKRDNKFELRYRAVPLSGEDREDSIKNIQNTAEASSIIMPNICAKSKRKKNVEDTKKNISTYTVKSLPQYGAYGFVNYNNDEETDFMYNINLNSSYNGGDFFEIK